MKAYVARNRSGAVTRGWILRPETPIGSSMCRLLLSPMNDNVEEVSVETAVDGAGSGRSRPRPPEQSKPR